MIRTPKRGKDPYIHIIDGIQTIKGRTHVNVLISYYTNKHITFNKEEYAEHLELLIEDIQHILYDTESLTTHSIITEKMMANKVEPDTFRPPHQKLRKDIETTLAELLKHYQSQFAHDETTIGTTPMTEMMMIPEFLSQFHRNLIQ